MLEMGVLPDVAAATSATMIMFTAASASAVFIGFGTVKYTSSTCCVIHPDQYKQLGWHQPTSS